ncbi:MAG: CCA tRNA nucleotidyltransferase [Alphaproteobacteria bacterium]|nr:CCA tRNA nucleotidyltransferase [Alphaproteobacteria bacterium]
MNAAQRIDVAWLKSGGAARVLALLNSGGEEARVVGGAVRNALWGLEPGDIDIATTALPEEVVRRARGAGIRSVPTGIDHGTVTLIVDGQPYEVTTLREDTETFGRKARVVFGRDWQRDAARRDFTINALSADATGLVFDPVGGLADAALRRVRFIGDADQRIAEDYLRILRFFRIHAAFGIGAVDRESYLACIRGRDGLSLLSAERVHNEMVKLLLAPGAVTVAAAMAEGGLLLQLGAGVACPERLARMIRIEAELGLAGHPMRRLAALSVAVTEDATRLSARLRLSNAQTRMLESMGQCTGALGRKDAAFARQLLYRLGADAFRDRVLLAWVRAGDDATSVRWHDLATLPQRWPVPKFPLRAGDFMRCGMTEGAALGQALAAAEGAWIAAGFPSDRQQLEEIRDAAMAAGAAL